MLPAPISPSALFVHIFPLLGAFTRTHMLLPSEFAATLLPSEFVAVLAVGLFNPLLGGEKILRVSGQKAACYNVAQVTSIHPVLTNGNKSHGNYTAVNPGNYASHFECTVAGFLAVLCNEIIQKPMDLSSK